MKFSDTRRRRELFLIVTINAHYVRNWGKNGSAFAAVIIKVNFGTSVLNEVTNCSCMCSFLTPKPLLFVFTY